MFGASSPSSEVSDLEARYLDRANGIALAALAGHVPIFALIAWVNDTGAPLAAALTALVALGPWLAARAFGGPRAVSVVHGFSAMCMGALLVHFGQGPAQIEMHFYFFAVLALLAFFGNPSVIAVAALTVIAHHVIFWAWLPRSVFNYDAPFWVVLVHIGFVVLETAAACGAARSFRRNVIGLEKLVQARTAELESRNRDALELEVAKGMAERANHAKSEFFANMSHELRTPLHAVLAYGRLGLEISTDVTVSDYLRRIVTSGDRLLLLLNDLLDLSKLDAHRVPLELAETDLRELVASVLAELQPSIRSKDLRAEVMFTTGAPCGPMQVDPSSMRQVFKNVLANAVRFSPAQGRIEIRFAAAELPPDSSASLPRPALEIAVRDEGVGIPAEELESIFDMFVQSRKARTNAAGTGLGLPICRQITERHCGTIRARNNPDAGATFSITLPLQVAVRDHAA